MPGPRLKEEAVQFGEGGRLLGVLTRPSTASSGQAAGPVFVLLNSGLLHRVGPARLHVRLARVLARSGFASIRIDLAGKGDSLSRPGFTNQQSVAADYAALVAVLDSRLGAADRVLMGICSGADNAVRLAIADERVVGTVLLDPICFPDPMFQARQLAAKYSDPSRYMAWFTRKQHALGKGPDKTPPEQVAAVKDPLSLRDLPTLEQMQRSFEAIGARQGRVLSVFTGYAVNAGLYYNKAGQLGDVLGVEGYEAFASEHFWPEVEHTYRLEPHRQRLLREINAWALTLCLKSGRRSVAAEAAL